MDAIWQQHIPHFHLVPSFTCSIVFYSLLSLVLGYIGILFFISASTLQSFTLDYGDLCDIDSGIKVSPIENGFSCQIVFSPDVDLSNALLYYELDEFYSNHRVFVGSSSYKQLRGEDIPIDSEYCDGARKIKDLLPLSTYKRFTDKNLETDFDPEDDLNPCGLKAKYLFTDSFELYQGDDAGSEVVNIEK